MFESRATVFVSGADLGLDTFSTPESVAISRVTDDEPDDEPVQKGPTKVQQILPKYTHRHKLAVGGKNKRFSLKVFDSGMNYPIFQCTFDFSLCFIFCFSKLTFSMGVFSYMGFGTH